MPLALQHHFLMFQELWVGEIGKGFGDMVLHFLSILLNKIDRVEVLTLRTMFGSISFDWKGLFNNISGKQFGNVNFWCLVCQKMMTSYSKNNVKNCSGTITFVWLNSWMGPTYFFFFPKRVEKLLFRSLVRLKKYILTKITSKYCY